MTADTVPTIALLNSLAEALNSATTAFPADEQAILPPTDGISLLDVKNDLLLSYLQNLVFLILLRLRSTQNARESETNNLNNEVVSKLVELRVYIDRGVRPLEGRLRYQIDKALRAAEETERLAAQRSKATTSKKGSRKSANRTATDGGSDESVNNSESEGSEDESAGEEDDEELEETLHRPNARALAQQMNITAKSQPKSSSSRRPTESNTGTYKPPKITPTAMPLPQSARDHADERSRRRKSNLLTEYIDEELSSAPRAQPSIGSNNTITGQGRGGISTRDRQKERERLEYEERNFVRLPAESKAEKRKAKARGERDRRDMFGGEDWIGLGGLGDRINRSVQQGKGKGSVLERREKRGRDTQDGQRGDGMGIGETFAKRQKILEDRAERKRRKRG